MPINMSGLFEYILNNSEDVILATDLHGKIIFSTPNVETLLKCKSAELEDHDIHEFYDAQKDFVVMIMERLMTEKEIRNLEITMKRKNGETFPVSLSAFLRTHDDGQHTGVIGIYRDITEKKRLEEQFLQSRKMEAVGTLAGGIAHDFNNLLMGIHGYTSLMLANMPASHPHHEKLKSIEQQIQSGADLTKKLLGFAKGGKYEVKPTDMNELVKKSAKIFGRTKKDICIHYRFAKQLWSTDVDPGQIDHVLLNLYINAWQSMPNGGDLYLETENVLLDELFMNTFKVKAGPYVKVSVCDTGVGMDEETKQHVFEPFFTTKEMGRGTGLGLSSAYGIIKSHGGIIKVYSEIGKGTQILFYLPASNNVVVERIMPQGRVKKGSGTILVIDDEEQVLHVTKEMLKMLGYRILNAKNGHEGVETYHKNCGSIDLVILDMIMPGMTGFETFEALKTIKSDVNVILSSGYSFNGQARDMIDRGCRGFIQKPYGILELSEKIWQVFIKTDDATYDMVQNNSLGR